MFSVLQNSIGRSLQCDKCKIMAHNIWIILNRHRIASVQHFHASKQLCITKDGREETTLEENPFYDKYAEKLQYLKRTDSGEFQSRLSQQKEKGTVDPVDHVGVSKGTASSSITKTSMTYSKAKSLNSIVKVDELMKHSSTEITEIWKQFYQGKDCVSAVIPDATYQRLNELAVQCPVFLYPLPKDTGYEFIVGQFQGHNCYFTPLIMYQTHRADAPSCLTLTHYTDLQKSKGIVLMCGEYDKNIVNVTEAQCLTNQVQLFYGSGDVARKALIEKFNFQPVEFKHMEIIEQFNQLGIT